MRTDGCACNGLAWSEQATLRSPTTGRLTRIIADGHRLYGATFDGSIVVWDVTSSDISVRKVSDEGLVSLCLHRSHLYAGSTAADGKIHSLDIKDLSKHRDLIGHHGSVLDMASFHDQLYSGGTDDTLIIWELNTGSPLESIHPHHHLVHAVAVDSDFIYTGGIDNRIRVYSRDDSSEVAVLEGTDASVLTLATDGHSLYSGSGELWWGGPGSPRPSVFESAVRVWDKRDWSCVATLRGHNDNVNRVLVQTGKLYSVSDDGVLMIHKTGSLEVLVRAVISHGPIYDIALFPEGICLVCDPSVVRRVRFNE